MNRLRERLIALTLIAALLFNYPLLSLAAVDGRIAGLPVLYVWLFGSWFLVILCTAWIHRSAGWGR